MIFLIRIFMVLYLIFLKFLWLLFFRNFEFFYHFIFNFNSDFFLIFYDFLEFFWWVFFHISGDHLRQALGDVGEAEQHQRDANGRVDDGNATAQWSLGADVPLNADFVQKSPKKLKNFQKILKFLIKKIG